MAEIREININIRKPKEKKEKTEEDIRKEEIKEFKKNLSKILHPFKTLYNETVGKNALLAYGLNKGFDIGVQAFNTHMQRYFSLSEDYMNENTYRNAMTAITKTKNLISSVTGGAMVGATFGPIGAAVGAVVGSASQVVSTIIENTNNLSQYYASINANNAQTAFSQYRAGLVNNSEGTEN